jgi:hypothetical protein
MLLLRVSEKPGRLLRANQNEVASAGDDYNAAFF